MLVFVIYVALFVCLVMGIDRTLTLLVPPSNSVFAHATTEKQQQLERKLDNALRDVDVITIGSSRAQFAFSPKAFAEVRSVRSYNAGVGGFVETFMHYDVLRRVLAQGNPKMIIYFVDDISLNYDPREEKTGQILHAFRSVNVLRTGFLGAVSAMASNGWQVPAYRPVELKLTPFTSYQGYKLHTDGWVEGKGVANPEEVRHKGVSFNPSEGAKAYLRYIIELCQENSVSLVLVSAPVHEQHLKVGLIRIVQFKKFMTQISSEFRVPFFHFADPGKYPLNDTSLFFDTSHLNEKGARLFSRRLAKAIQSQGIRSPRQ